MSLTPPLRFGVANPDLFHGAYPTLQNFKFLSKLKLKTIISLIPESPNGDLESFCNQLNISLNHFQVTIKL